MIGRSIMNLRFKQGIATAVSIFMILQSVYSFAATSGADSTIYRLMQ